VVSFSIANQSLATTSSRETALAFATARKIAFSVPILSAS
jgi:hypothetical protein